MSILFTPMNIGKMEVKNRFVRSATYYGMALETGEITDKLINGYRNLGKGEVGLIISGYLKPKNRGKITSGNLIKMIWPPQT